jgi:hypothetical protein
VPNGHAEAILGADDPNARQDACRAGAQGEYTKPDCALKASLEKHRAENCFAEGRPSKSTVTAGSKKTAPRRTGKTAAPLTHKAAETSIRRKCPVGAKPAKTARTSKTAKTVAVAAAQIATARRSVTEIAPPVDEAEACKASQPKRDASKPAKKKSAKRKTSHKPKDLVQKVYDTINTELSKLDQHRGASSQDRERASRALSQMVNSLEKAIEMQRQIAQDKGGAAALKDTEALRDAEDLRRQIAERLERINRQREPGEGSANPDAG